MKLVARLTLALASLALLPAHSLAEGLVQLSLNGFVGQEGGGPCEVNWSALGPNGTVVQGGVRVHLAVSTKAADLRALVADRMRRSGVRIIVPEGSSDGSSVLFLEEAVSLDVRLARGLRPTITVCEGAPESVHFSPSRMPASEVEPGRALVSVSTFHPHTRSLGLVELAVPLDHETSPGEVCEGLFQQGLERGLVGDRPSADLWRPMKASDGAQVTGCSVTLRASNTGWGLQVRLAAPR